MSSVGTCSRVPRPRVNGAIHIRFGQARRPIWIGSKRVVMNSLKIHAIPRHASRAWRTFISHYPLREGILRFVAIGERRMNSTEAMDNLVSDAEELLAKLKDTSNPDIQKLRTKVESGIAEAKQAATQQAQL